MGCGCNGVSNGQTETVLEINNSTLTTCGAPQCGAPVDSCSDGVPPGTPVPYYMQAPSIQQTNCQQFTNETFSTTVKTSTAWNVPVCGGTASATFKLPNVTTMLVGSNLWNEAYGYFEVIAWEASTQLVTVSNNCIDGNVAAGTPIPACTEFLVIGPVCDCSGGGSGAGRFVAIDFTAPAVGDCIDITVTSIEDLVIGKNIEIGSGIYRLNGILSNEVITICNDGSGITPGTSVIAKNASGDYQYPITVIDTNPCTNPAKTTGALLICDGSGLTQPLDGATAGMIPVLVNPTTNAVEFQALDIPARHCTYLTAVLTLVPAVANYVLNVADSSGFVVGQKIQIQDRTDRLTITLIPSPTQIQGTMDPIPAAIENIPVGTAVCEQFCCDEVADEAKCLPQVIIGDIPLSFLNYNITLGAGITFEERIDGTTILRLPIPEGECPNQAYELVGEVGLYALTSTVDNGAAPSCMLHEIEMAWVIGAAAPVGSRTNGKMVWTVFGMDTMRAGGGKPAIPPTPPSTQAAIWTQLVGATPSNATRSIIYHGETIQFRRNVVAGEVLDVAAIYKTMIGQNGSPNTIYPTLCMVAGTWELRRI